MSRTLVAFAIITAWVFATPTRADMAAAFGNTVISRYPDGGWVKHYFSADGGYSAVWSSGKRLTARWTRQDDRVCLTDIRPRMLIPRFCTPLIEAEVGDSWSARDPLGRRVHNTLLRGRH